MKRTILMACGLTCLMAVAAAQADSLMLERQAARLNQGGPTTAAMPLGDGVAEGSPAYWEQRSARLQQPLSPRISQRTYRRPVGAGNPWR
ncbi:hypothetical protein LG302_07035 [Halomonas organivorans]